MSHRTTPLLNHPPIRPSHVPSASAGLFNLLKLYSPETCIFEKRKSIIGLFSIHILPGNLKLYFSERKPIIYSGNQSDWFRFPGATFPWKSIGILSELIIREIKSTIREGFRFPGATFPGKSLMHPDGKIHRAQRTWLVASTSPTCARA